MDDLVRILLVEDNYDDYEATIRSLKKNHFMNPIIWCKSGRDALDYLHKKGSYVDDVSPHPALILLDLNLPGIDGRAVLEHIKADNDLRRIPVIVLTTSSDFKDVDYCYAYGASTYIQKPVSFEGLEIAIRTMKDYWFGVAILPGSNDQREGYGEVNHG